MYVWESVHVSECVCVSRVWLRGSEGGSGPDVIIRASPGFKLPTPSSLPRSPSSCLSTTVHWCRIGSVLLVYLAGRLAYLRPLCVVCVVKHLQLGCIFKCPTITLHILSLARPLVHLQIIFCLCYVVVVVVFKFPCRHFGSVFGCLVFLCLFDIV